MESIRQIYAKREGTKVSHEQVPVSYYDEEVFKNRVERYKENLKNYFKGKDVILNRLKREQTYDSEMQSSVSDNVLFRVNQIEKIVRTSNFPLTEKIILKDREIEFRVDKGQMRICSRRYSDKKPIIAYRISKKVRSDLSSEEVLRNAEKGIISRLTDMEFDRRRGELHNGLVNYQKRQEDSRKRQWNQLFEQIGGGIDPEIMTAIHEMEREKSAA
jgi:hypothetical protein